MALILDTGPVFALLDQRDSDHDACLELIETIREPLVIPAPVLPEVDYLVRTRLHPGVALAFLNDLVDGIYFVEDLKEVDYLRALDLCERYLDANIGFVDAAVLAIVERLNEPKLATLDRRNFLMLRPRHVDALRLLPD